MELQGKKFVINFAALVDHEWGGNYLPVKTMLRMFFLFAILLMGTSFPTQMANKKSPD